MPESATMNVSLADSELKSDKIQITSDSLVRLAWNHSNTWRQENVLVETTNLEAALRRRKGQREELPEREVCNDPAAERWRLDVYFSQRDASYVGHRFYCLIGLPTGLRMDMHKPAAFLI